LLAQNTPGLLPRTNPVFIAQGSADGLVRPQVTAAYARALCRNGNAVTYDSVERAGHAFIARDAATAAIAWIAGRFAGAAPSSNCFPQFRRMSPR
jgi:acetyl esterase/lipase